MSKPFDDSWRTLPDPSTWKRLTDAPWKTTEYAVDGLFREGWADLLRLTEDQGSFAISCMTSLILKPETLARRSSRKVVELIREQGFRIALAKKIDLNRHTVQAVWRYQMDLASDDRILLRTLPLAPTEAIYLILQTDPADRSAAERLRAFKGSSHAHLQKTGQLRSQLQLPNPTISFVHAPDDSADFIRELPVWLNFAERRGCKQLFSGPIDRQHSEKEESKLAAFENDVENYQFDIRTMKESILEYASSNEEVTHMVRLCLDESHFLELSKFCEVLHKNGLPLKNWDNFFFVSEYLRADVEPLRMREPQAASVNDESMSQSISDIVDLPLFREAREAWDVVCAELSKRYGPVASLATTLEQESAILGADCDGYPFSLIGIAGAGGSGKDTVIEELLTRLPNARFVPHATTRTPRQDEIEGKDYFYISDEEFDKKVRRDEFLYVREIEGRGRYGLLHEALVNGGYINIVKESPSALRHVSQMLRAQNEATRPILVYIIPPHPIFPTLVDRVLDRDGHTSQGKTSGLLNTLRPANAIEFLSAIQIYEMYGDFSFVVNDDVDKAIDKILAMVTPEHLNAAHEKSRQLR
jgi:guanylate kinase